MDATVTWPIRDGNYIVADPDAPVAVCTLTDHRLPEQVATLPGVAIVGTLATANLGIERLVANVIANPAVGHLVVCGKDSALFGQGQSLLALATAGIDTGQRIQGATGFDPVLRNLPVEHIDQFRTYVTVVDHIGVDDLAAIAELVDLLAARPVAQRASATRIDRAPVEEFTMLPAGGRRRQAVDYDPAGFLVVTLDRPAGQILVRHYRPDNRPAHQIRSRNGEAILLALLDQGLVTQLDHAGYLGAELAKAEAALRLGLRYVQDRPLRLDPTTNTTSTERNAVMSTPSTSADETSAAPAPAAAPAVGATQTHHAFAATAPGAEVDITVEIAGHPDGQAFDATVADPDPADPYTRYRRSSHPARIRYDETTRIAMGTTDDIIAGAVVRARGTLGDDGQVRAVAMAILTKAVTITG